MASNIYYKILNGGSTTHFSKLSTARKAANRIASQTGRAVSIDKMSHKQYHKTGSARVGAAATVEPTRKAKKNPATIRAKRIEVVRNARGQAVKLRIFR